MSPTTLFPIAATMAIVAVLATASTAEASHRRRHHHEAHATTMVDVPARGVAAFRRAHVDRFIGPRGSWTDAKRTIYLPYHYWRGPVTIMPPYARHGYANTAYRTFACAETIHGRMCREKL
ncbi:MAG: hypothetical protein ACKVP4_03190 [Hyphomicrobium sp.]